MVGGGGGSGLRGVESCFGGVWGVGGKPWPGRAEENLGILGSFRLCQRANPV